MTAFEISRLERRHRDRLAPASSSSAACKRSKILASHKNGDVAIAAKLRRAVQHAGLAAHQQVPDLVGRERRKDFVNRVRDQANLPRSDRTPTTCSTPATLQRRECIPVLPLGIEPFVHTTIVSYFRRRPTERREPSKNEPRQLNRRRFDEIGCQLLPFGAAVAVPPFVGSVARPGLFKRQLRERRWSVAAFLVTMVRILLHAPQNDIFEFLGYRRVVLARRDHFLRASGDRRRSPNFPTETAAGPALLVRLHQPQRIRHLPRGRRRCRRRWLTRAT